MPAPLPWAVPAAVAPGLVQLNRPDPPLNVQDPDTEAAGPSAGWKVTGCAATMARSVATLDPDSRGPLLGTAPISHVQFLPFCPVLCAGASGSHAIKHPKGQGLGMCNNSEGTPGRGSVTLARQDPPSVSGTGARGSGWGRSVPLPCEPRFTRTGRGALRVDNRENQKPILFLIILLIISRNTMPCFTLTAVALLLSFYTVVFIKMSFGFNKGVSCQPAPAWKLALRLPRALFSVMPGWGGHATVPRRPRPGAGGASPPPGGGGGYILGAGSEHGWVPLQPVSLQGRTGPPASKRSSTGQIGVLCLQELPHWPLASNHLARAVSLQRQRGRKVT